MFSERTEADIAVVGAGPAGAACARHAAAAGLRVVLLERARIPRDKACAGGLPAKTLAEIGGDLGDVAEVSITAAETALRSAQRVRMQLQRPLGVTVMRDRFDAYLVQRAAAEGAEVRDGCEVTGLDEDPGGVTLRTAAGPLRASLVVGADGPRSLVARRTGLAAALRCGIAIEAEVEVPDEDLRRHGPTMTLSFGSAPRGYAWIFPKRGHLSAGVFATATPAPGLQRALDRFLDAEPALRRRTAVPYRRGHPIPLGGDRLALQRGRVLLAGDAAGLADPFLGEGIYYALVSGRLAAAHAAAFLGGDAGALARYERAVHATLTGDLRWARFYTRTVLTRPDRFYPPASRSPISRRVITRLVAGDLTFRAAVIRNLAEGPLMPLWMLFALPLTNETPRA